MQGLDCPIEKLELEKLESVANKLLRVVRDYLEIRGSYNAQNAALAIGSLFGLAIVRSFNTKPSETQPPSQKQIEEINVSVLYYIDGPIKHFCHLLEVTTEWDLNIKVPPHKQPVLSVTDIIKDLETPFITALNKLGITHRDAPYFTAFASVKLIKLSEQDLSPLIAKRLFISSSEDACIMALSQIWFRVP
jgi:hypothetical protein